MLQILFESQSANSSKNSVTLAKAVAQLSAWQKLKHTMQFGAEHIH
jgi:hypothetical protein